MTQVARLTIGVALAALSAVLLTISFTPYGLWPLVWVAFVPAIVAQHRVMPRRFSGLAYGIALGGFFWGYYGPMFAGTVWFMEWLPLIVGVIATLLSSGDRAFQERTGYKWFVLEGAVVWVGIEAIRGFIPVIGTGGFVAYALYNQPILLQPVGIFSIYGLSLLIMLVNYALGLGALFLVDRRFHLGLNTAAVPARVATTWLLGMVAVLIVWSGLGVYLLGEASVPGSSVQVAAIQPVGSTSNAEAVATMSDLTREAAAQGAQLVVWPEGSVSVDPRLGYAEQLKSLAAETNSHIVVGYGFNTPQGLRNETVMVTPDGRFLGPYGKDHPVAWLGETSVTGGSFPAYDTPLGKVGTIICYDLNFTDTPRRMAANGAQIITASSHDWPGLADRQYTYLTMRAVENRVAVVKADGNYDSAIIDPTGLIVSTASSTKPRQALLVATVPLGAANAPLIQLGDWVGWLCIAGIVVFAVAGIVVARRRPAVPVPVEAEERAASVEQQAPVPGN